jgi:hypothetical protein
VKPESERGRECGCKGPGGAQAAGLDRRTEYHRVIDSFDVFSIPARMRAEIREALDSPLWDWFKDCDGCTCVSEVYWPTKYFPPCLRHDFDCATGHNGLQASRRFYRIQRAYRMGRLHAGLRFLGVTAAWYVWLKWR